MTRGLFATLAAVIVIAGLTIVGARLVGRTNQRAATLVSVIAHWLAAYVLWNFAGGLALHYGLLTAYPGAFFGLVAPIGGFWHYRTAMRAGPERGLTVFVGVQVAWLVLVLAQNGVFSGSSD
jgi:hypothetical protein